ncbi:sciellin [Capricornis sumatraensis]|uniref:sciellin n=1 Tax=Capricornis sumatraensis TaxID=34865 RepID=UPI0036044E12
MSNFTLRKTSPTGNDMRTTTQGTTLRQQGFQEVNKRRTFLQDNSWIKKRPEEERDENYGRAVLHRHNSHDALDRKTNEREEPKATISRYRSDVTLDRISNRNDAAKTYKANTLDNRLTNRNMSTFQPPEVTKTQPGGLSGANATNTPASTSTTTPVKKKRQSWFPPPPPGYNTTPNTGASRREPTVHPPIPPKPSSAVSSPNQLKQDNRQIYPAKPSVYTEANRSAERSIRSQDLESIVKVATSLQKTNKGEELDNLIKMNKSLNRNQGLDGLFRANLKSELTEKRSKSLENLIFVNTRTDKDGKGNQGLGSLIKVNQRAEKIEKRSQDLKEVIKANATTDQTSRGSKGLDSIIKVNPKESANTTGKQDLNGLIKVNPETNKNIKRGQSLDNLIQVTPEINRSNLSSKNLDNLIKVNPRTGKSVQGDQSLDNIIKVTPGTNKTNQGSQDLDSLIKVTPSAKKNSEQGLDELINVSPKAVKNTARNQDLDKLIKVNPEILLNNQRNQDLDNLIKVNPAVIRSNQSQALDNLIQVKPSALRNTKRDQNLENLIDINYNVSKNKNESSNAETRHAGSKDTVVYTRTYVENSKSPKDGYQETVSGKYIQTVYSTSDRSVIERDMCTYCRKPLGTETKMILDELQICCHSTCFKCEICKQPLENLQAGDSIWIYRQTIHCESCYSKVVGSRNEEDWGLLSLNSSTLEPWLVDAVVQHKRSGRRANLRAFAASRQGRHLQRLLFWNIAPGSQVGAARSPAAARGSAGGGKVLAGSNQAPWGWVAWAGAVAQGPRPAPRPSRAPRAPTSKARPTPRPRPPGARAPPRPGAAAKTRSLHGAQGTGGTL